MLAQLLLPESTDLRLDTVNLDDARGLVLFATATQPEAACPLCGQASRQVHSGYQRTVADLPCVGIPMQLIVHVRRFFCRNDGCKRVTFAERLPRVVAPWARRTLRLAEKQRQIGQALGGEASARLAHGIGVAASPDTFLRLVRCSPQGEVATPRVLGVDDWARRKGQTYGTILVDLEAHRVVDLLPDRSADVLEQWLHAHPGVQVISRDRAAAYADGASRGAPEAIQVADRFHLLQNLREVLERLLDRNQVSLQMAATPVGDPSAGAPNDDLPQSDSDTTSNHTQPTTEVDLILQGRRASRQTRYEQVVALHKQGVSMREITKQLHMSRRTVRRYVQADRFPETARRRRRRSLLDPYEPYLKQQLAAGQDNGVQLWREICTRGYKGSRSLVSRWVARHRPHPSGQKASKRRGRPPAPKRSEASPRPLSARQGSWLLVCRPERLAEEEREKVERLCQASKDVATGYRLGQEFAQLVRERKGEVLDPWLDAAASSGLPDFARFAAGIQRDHAAVMAALTLPWSNGQTEGQVNRLKLIKRQMYGRANFDLLKRRVLVT